MTSIDVLFSDHGTIRDNSTVAGKEIDRLIEEAKPGLDVQRVIEPSKPFDKAVLHLDEQDLQAICKSKHGFVALRVTTQPGIPPDEGHRLHENPTRILLAVRRMEALTAESWKAFLRASEADCRAIAKGRLEDVADDVKPMLALFFESEVGRSEVLPALAILCIAYQEIAERKVLGGTFWAQKADMVSEVHWWRSVLATATCGTKNKTRTWGDFWRDLQNGKVDNPQAATDCIMDRVSLEALRHDKEAEERVRALVSAINGNNGRITDDLVADASTALKTLMQ